MVVTQRRSQAFAADVGDENRGAVFVDRNHVEVVAADFSAGMMHAGDGKIRKVVQAVGNERLLDGARDGKLLLQALALAFPLHQARVVQNAGGLDRERVENLAVDGGEGRDAPRIEIDDAEQRAALQVGAPVSAVARDEAYSGMATTARNPCTTTLSAPFRSRPARFRSSVITLDLLADGLIDRGLAGVDGLRRQVVALVAAGQANAHDVPAASGSMSSPRSAWVMEMA